MEPLHSYALEAGSRDTSKSRILLHDCSMTNINTPKASSLLGEEVRSQMSQDDIYEMDALADVYYHPEISAENTAVYGYCKSLEFAETALLSGFYHKHFELAANVIGSLGKGTLTRNVQALRASHSASCFAVLDVIRYTIATPYDEDLSARKGNLINGYVHKRGWPLVPGTVFPVPPLIKGISINNTK